jgi:hypothetical protein
LGGCLLVAFFLAEIEGLNIYDRVYLFSGAIDYILKVPYL